MQKADDWFGEEEALAAQLPAAPLPGASVSAARTNLLAALGRYARAAVHAARADVQPALPAGEIEAARSWLMRPVFICGHHRSGTTFLQELLDGHPALLGLPSEGTYFSSFRRVALDDPASQDLDAFAAEWISRFIDPNYEPHFRLGRSSPAGNPYVLFARRLFTWQAALRRSCPEVARFAALLALVAAYRDVTQPECEPRLWVEKTPLNERFLPRFAAFPEARFIHVVRDPRDSLASLLALLRRAGIAEPDSAAHASDIGHSLRLAQTNMRRDPRRYLVVRYEDLVESCSSEMERVRSFLGIEPHAALSAPTSAGNAVRSNSAFTRSEPGAIRKSAQGSQLTRHQLQELAASSAAIARVFGYALPSADRWFSLGFHLRDLPFAMKRYLRIALR